jgi:hypothetical protein
MLLTSVPKKSSYKPGEHPRSQENLIHEGRPSLYEENKKRREVLATETGWEGFKQIARELGLSASELVEQIGRRRLTVGKDLSIEISTEET